MKQIYSFAVLALLCMAGCKSEKKGEQEEVKQMFQIESVDENTGLQRMQVSNIKQEISCKGKVFQLTVERTPSEELPHVKSDMGLFVDNLKAIAKACKLKVGQIFVKLLSNG